MNVVVDARYLPRFGIYRNGNRHSHPGTRACRAAPPNCRENTNDSLTKGIVRDSSHLRRKATSWQATPLGMTNGCSVTLLAEVEAVHSRNFIASRSDRLAAPRISARGRSNTRLAFPAGG